MSAEDTADSPLADPERPAGREDFTGRRVLLASPRGFCAGVERAVATVEKALEQYGAPVYVRRQIVHNHYVVRALEQRGAVFVEEVSEVPAGSVVVFSAHGVAPGVREEAARGGLAAIDATCPLVAKVHSEARRFASEGYDILLVGQDGHDEVVGTVGEAPGRIHVVADAESVARTEVQDAGKVAWLSQTTLSVDETTTTVALLKERFPWLVGPPSDDICYAAQNRQTAVRALAQRADLVVVVGSGTSHNSAQLVKVALEHGAKAAHLIDDEGGLDEDWLRGAGTVGVTGGASVPEILVEGVLRRLARLGYDDVRTVHTGSETQQFALPRELMLSRAELLARPGAAPESPARPGAARRG
ncbi:4-hydroxy-3-methylbut-2-enyl diphosphate reductase [Streptomyces sp. NPDC088387]|uniref:4-hydroxy-3-methylbut-2-enyl diphosphate reductase n=1 Tax=Streptomyces sp. NPDC088387 TaxID=3365859 RepID=UPI0038238A86